MIASLHWRTPALAVIDGRGLPIRQVAYLRSAANGAASAIVTAQEHDVAGRLVAQHDPRLPVANATTVYTLNGDALFTDSVDGGWRLILPGLASEPRQRWDARGHHWQSTFDNQMRVVGLQVTGNGEDQTDTFTYADGEVSASHNLRGQLIEQTDSSGSLGISSHALVGPSLIETRTFHDDAAFTSRQVFSPLGALLEQIDAGGHRRQFCYGLAGQLRRVDLWIDGQVRKPVAGHTLQRQ